MLVVQNLVCFIIMLTFDTSLEFVPLALSYGDLFTSSGIELRTLGLKAYLQSFTLYSPLLSTRIFTFTLMDTYNWK